MVLLKSTDFSKRYTTLVTFTHSHTHIHRERSSASIFYSQWNSHWEPFAFHYLKSIRQHAVVSYTPQKTCHWDFVLHQCWWKKTLHISNKYLILIAFREKDKQASFPKALKQRLTQSYCYSSSVFRSVIGQKSIYLNRFVLIIRLTMIQSISTVQRLCPALWFKMWEHPPRLIESSRNNDIEKRLM